MIINKHGKFKIWSGEMVASMLGFDFNITFRAGVFVSSTSSLYVYSSIVESTIVGDIYAPLLWVLPPNHAETRGD